MRFILKWARSQRGNSRSELLFCDSTLSFDGRGTNSPNPRTGRLSPPADSPIPIPTQGTLTSRDELLGNVPRTTANLWVNNRSVRAEGRFGNVRATIRAHELRFRGSWRACRLSPDLSGRPRPFLAPTSGGVRGTMPSPALLVLHRKRIAHELEQLSSGPSSMSWIQAPKSTDGPAPLTRPTSATDGVSRGSLKAHPGVGRGIMSRSRRGRCSGSLRPSA